MRKNILLIYAVIATLCLSCSKNIDLQSDAIITNESFFANENDFRLALNGAYTGFNAHEGYPTGTEMWIEATTDNAITTHSWNMSYQLGQGTANTSDRYASGKWNAKYDVIQRCNTILQNIDKIEWSSEEERLNVIAEAKMMRAIYFTDLAVYFDRPMIITETPTSDNVFSAATQAESAVEAFEFALTEMKSCVDDLKENPNTQKTTLSRAAGYAYLARTASLLAGYTNDDKYWQDVLTATNIVLEAGYSLHPDYTELFYIGENSNESIFVRQYDEVQMKTHIGEWIPQSQGGFNVITPTKALVDSYEYMDLDGNGTYKSETNLPYTNKDPRFYASIYAPGSKIFAKTQGGGYRYFNSIPHNIEEREVGSGTWYFASNQDYAKFNDLPINTGDVLGENHPGVSSWNISRTGFSFKKYQRDIIIETNDVSYILLRKAEFMLLRAEALAETGGSLSEIEALLTEVRARGGNDIPVSVALAQFYGGNMIEMIRNERRVELAFEGQRPYDIRRWGIYEEVCSAPVEGIEYRVFDDNGNVTNENFVLEVIGAEARKIVGTKYHIWPIPQAEVDADKNGLITQNSNWL